MTFAERERARRLEVHLGKHNGKALDLVAIGRSRVLPGRELVIQRAISLG